MILILSLLLRSGSSYTTLLSKLKIYLIILFVELSRADQLVFYKDFYKFSFSIPSRPTLQEQ